MPKGFYIDPAITFDVAKMQEALKEVDSRVARQSPLGERDINAICLTQIPEILIQLQVEMLEDCFGQNLIALMKKYREKK